MAKYIDRDKLIMEGWSLQRTYQKDADTMVCEMKKPEDFPAADVRPVVLCGVCRWFIDTGYPEIGLDIPELRTGYCRVLGRDVQACWFCGAGEQKEDADGNTQD